MMGELNKPKAMSFIELCRIVIAISAGVCFGLHFESFFVGFGILNFFIFWELTLND